VIEREECPTHGVDYGNPGIEPGGERRCARPRCRKTLVRVEYVPRSELAGAVGAARLAREQVATLLVLSEGAQADVLRDVVRLLDRAIGAQS
jgi:hypothetical protein